MILTETILTNLFDNRLAQIPIEIEELSAIATQLKNKRQQLTQLFYQANSALNVISKLTALFPQTSTEIRATLEAIFQQYKPENCPVSEVKHQTKSHLIIQVAHQLIPILKQGQPISNTAVSSMMAETFSGSDTEDNWLWKDAYEALEIAQILLIQQQGKELLNQSNRLAILEEIE
ncbi:MAG UNVERIFIED_CONTAM: hypothetical protein LVR29_33285 [Microcystis novacekii LVE1205-3]|jgi:hypothetical protein